MDTATLKPTYGTVPRCFDGETIVCLGTGPSLRREDVEFCRGRARIIAIKNAIELAPFADVIYSAGGDITRWWQRNGPTLKWFTGLRFTLDPAAAEWATLLKNTGFIGLERNPNGLRTGKNSGYQAINLAVLLGAAKIVLLGYDMQQGPHGEDHFFGTHPSKAKPTLGVFVPLFSQLVGPLRELQIPIINATRSTALTCFPRQSLQEALA